MSQAKKLFKLVEDSKKVFDDTDDHQPLKLPEPGRLTPGTVAYIVDFRSSKLVYNEGFDKVLGYGKDTQIDLKFIADTIIHPEDKPIVQYLSMMAAKYMIEKNVVLGIGSYESLISLTYRVKTADGSYKMMLRRSTGYERDSRGVGNSNISYLHEISFLNLSNKVRCTLIGPAEIVSDFDSFILQAANLSDNDKKNSVFSKREMHVLHYLAQGFTSIEIAEKLFISKHTVDNHRKNMLRKSNSRSATELLHYALSKQLL